MRIGIIVCAAGKGTRVGGDIPKQFIKIGEKRVIDYTLDNILMSGVFDDVILVVRPGDRPEYENYWGRCVFVDGDTEDGQNSRRLGLKYAKDVLGYEDDDLIGIADGNRPFITSEFYWMLVNVAKTKGNAVPYMIQRDILIRYDGEKVTLPGWSRNDYKVTLAPSFFPFKLMLDVYEDAYDKGTLKDSEGVVSLIVERLAIFDLNDRINLVRGDSLCFKITTPDDVEMAKLIMKGLEN
jgi:2-C-methyl-D-erythritol 4-phosphate cytidylyltransferase